MNLAVGFFDGVHVGHRRILACADAALTFRAHPACVLAPARAPALLMTSRDRIAAVEAALRPGAPGRVRALDFTPEFAAEPAEEFAAWLRRAYPGLDEILCGPNWRFGAEGAGDAAFLRERGFAVRSMPFVEVDGAPVSSTRIRAAIAAGDIAAAVRLLGRPWRVEGEVVPGKGLGRALGFPTMNVKVAEGLVRPPCGVYAAETPLGRAVANWGVAPTMGDRAWREPVLEVHVISGGPVAAPKTLAVDFLAFIRPERVFSGEDALRRQIAADIDSCRIASGPQIWHNMPHRRAAVAAPR